MIDISKKHISQIRQINPELNDGIIKNIISQKHFAKAIEIENKIISFILAIKTEDFFEIVDINTNKKFRQKGFATKLLNSLIKTGTEKKINDIFLEVDINNISAINLYKKLGFHKINIRQNYYTKKDGSKSDAVVMKKPLSFNP